MQAIDRVYRIGQNKDVRVFQFIAANTVEEKVLEIQKRKNLLISQVSPSFARLIRSTESLLHRHSLVRRERAWGRGRRKRLGWRRSESCSPEVVVPFPLRIVPACAPSFGIYVVSPSPKPGPIREREL